MGYLNKQKCLFKMENRSNLGVDTSGRGDDKRKRCRRVNVVEICSHV
jgi:hypothetical protein